MQSKEDGNLVILRLFTGEDLYLSLQQVCQRYDIETAVVLSAVGQLKQFTLGYFKGKYVLKEYEEAYELLSIDGIISRDENEYKLHVHAVLGNANMAVVGGHLMNGTANATNEIVLLKTNIKIKRKIENTGLQGLYLNDQSDSSVV